MSTYKFKNIICSLLPSILVLGLLLSSCQQDANEFTETSFAQNPDSVEDKLLNSDEILNFDSSTNGVLETDYIQNVFSETGNDGEIIVSMYKIPLQMTSGQESKNLYALYEKDSDEFQFAIYNVKLDDGLYAKILDNNELDFQSLTKEEFANLGIAYTAEETMYNLSGEIVAKVSYKENEKTMDNDYAESRGFLEVYCMMVCVIDKMGFWDKIVCGAAIAACWASLGLTCVASVASCGSGNTDSYNDCYNNHCYVEVAPQCNANPPDLVWTGALASTYTDLQWSAVSGAISYTLVYWNGSGWTNFHTTTATSSRVSLSPNSSYYLGVKTNCPGRSSSVNWTWVQTLSGKVTNVKTNMDLDNLNIEKAKDVPLSTTIKPTKDS